MHRALHACVIAGLLLNHNPSFAAEQCERAELASLTDADLLLRPPLGADITSVDFAKAKST